MPSIEAVEQFKTIVQGLAREPEIRAQLGLAAEEILPPESQLDDDLASLLGGMPDSAGGEVGAPDEDGGPSSVADLDDLFAAPLPDQDVPVGPSLDDLLGPPAPLAELDDLGDLDALEEPSEPAFDTADAALDDLFGDLAASAEPPEAEAVDAAPVDEFDALGSLDDFLGPDPRAAAANPVPDGPKRSTSGVSPEDLDDAFFETPGEELYGSSPSSTAMPPEDEYEFGDALGDADFPELAGFADTKEEDVEAFDAMGEADEFQLGDFESQFGITADDHTDAEILNPAQSVELEVASAQKTLSLSDEEFLTIQRALGHLPLNLRLAVEELIGEKPVILDDLDKVVRLLLAGAPARPLAALVGRILGKKIVIPPGFEKGSGADLEARHGTLWYNIRTIMLPVLRVAAVATVAAAILVVLGWNFLLRPWKANDLYEQGLVAVQQNKGQLADDLFAQAYYEWPVQDRFFQYAEAYQDTGDYDRARRKYLELLKPSVRLYRDEDKPLLDQRFGKPLAPLSDGLEGNELSEALAAKKQAGDEYYRYVTALLGGQEEEAGAGELPGEVILGNPDTKGILDYSQFETDFGFDGRDKEAHFRRADAVLKPLLSRSPGHKPGLLRRADNLLAWTQASSSREVLDQANSVLSEYLRLYSWEAPVTWRFVQLFLLQDNEKELLALRDRIHTDTRMAMDGETMAKLAAWLLDREAAQQASERAIPVAQKTIEEEYGVRPKLPELPEALTDEELAEISAAMKEQRARLDAMAAESGGGAAPAAGGGGAAHSLTQRAAAAPAEGGHGGGEGEGAAKIELDPPYKYPNSSQPYRPDFVDKVDGLLLRAMDSSKTLPELHYQLSRFYRHSQAKQDEKRALAAADTYFQRLEPRKARLNNRPALRVATSNRIGEIFDAEGQPLQAEKYYLDARKTFESMQAQGLVSFDLDAARLYRNLGNLYYRQTPGVEAAGRGTTPGGWEQALKLFETAEKGTWEEPAMTYRLGVIQYERQSFGEAVKRFFTLDRPGNRGETSGRDNPNLLYAMGNALFRSGNYASAEGYYRQLLGILRDQRSRITEWDPVGRSSHRALAQRLYETWNNLAAAQYRASNAFRAGTPEFREALTSLTTARAQAQILGRDLYEDKAELDITAVDPTKLQEIRDDEARVIARTRQEKGLVEANLQVLSMIETVAPSRKAALASQLEIFARIPLELDQTEAP